MSAAADRNLLFGILALQMDFISRDQLIAGMNRWVLDKPSSLGRIFVEQGALAQSDHDLLAPLVDAHIRKHGNDAQQSLAALSSVDSARKWLEGIADSDVQASLGASRRREVDDPFATRSVGEPTSTGSRFRILRPHAEGGLGTVSVARDEELHREVALKEIKDHYATDREAHSRFLLEAEITAGLEHPGIVPVYGLGHYPDGRPFYAMRFIRGDSLKEAIEHFHRGRSNGAPVEGDRGLELRKLVGRLIDVCQALQYAHDRGVLHRDLKPGNIMLGKYGETLIVDWGLAKVLGGKSQPEGRSGGLGEPPLLPASSSGHAETVAGAALGTPAFMSPEQATGRVDLLGPASDVYSLGATLYAVLTGRPPVESKDVADALRRVRDGEFPRPRRHDATIAPALEAICLKAMSVNPADRYASPRALAEDLERWQADEPVGAMPEPFASKLARWVRKHRTLVSGAAVAVIVAVVGLLTVALVLEDANRELKIESAKVTDQLEKTQVAESTSAVNAERFRQASETAQARLTDLQIANGRRLSDQGELFAALPWLIRPLEDDRRGPEVERTHRFRFTSVLRQCPTLVQLWHLDKGVSHGEFDAAGDHVLATSAKALYVWEASSGKPRFSPIEHPYAVTHAAFSPDGALLVSACGTLGVAGEARVWDAKTGKAVTGPIHLGPCVHHAVFSPNSKYVVTCSDDHAARVWNARTGEPVTPPLRESAAPMFAAFSHDSKRVATGVYDGTARVWTVPEGKAATPVMKHESVGATLLPFSGGHPSNSLLAVAFSPDDRRLVTASRDGTALVWDTATGKPALPTLRHDNVVLGALFSRDGKTILTVSHDRTARLWDAAQGRRIGTPIRHAAGVTKAVFSPDGLHLITSCTDGMVHVWNLEDRRSVTTLLHSRAIRSLAVAPDSRRVLTASGDGLVRVWELPARSQPEPILLPPGDWGPIVASAPGGVRLATVSFDRVTIWDDAAGKLLMPARRHKVPIVAMAFGRLGSHLATLDRDGFAIVWDAGSGKPAGPPIQHATASRVDLSDDGRWLATTSHLDGTRLWDRRRGESVGAPLKQSRSVHAATFAPEGDRVVTHGTTDGAAQVWERATGRPLANLQTQGQVNAVAFSPNGQVVAIACGDHAVRVYDAGRGSLLFPPLQHGGGVFEIAFSGDGKSLVSTSADLTARVWDAATGTLRGPPLRPEGRILDIQISADGAQVVTACDSHQACVWETTGGRPLTPILKHPRAVNRVVLGDDHRFVTTSAPALAYRWHMPSDQRPLADLLRLCEVLSGQRLDPAGLPSLASAESVAEHWNHLRAKYPDDFTVTTKQVKSWHLLQADMSAESRRWASAVFHLDRYLTHEPDDWIALLKRGQAHLFLGRWPEALRDGTRARTIQPDYWQVWTTIAQAEAALGNRKAAVAAYAEAIERHGLLDWARKAREDLEKGPGEPGNR